MLLPRPHFPTPERVREHVGSILRLLQAGKVLIRESNAATENMLYRGSEHYNGDSPMELCRNGHDTSSVGLNTLNFCRACHRESTREYARKKYLIDREKFLEKNRKWANRNQKKLYKRLVVWRSENNFKVILYALKHNKKRKLRIPRFGQEGIEEFYVNCPQGYEVDHIIPLLGRKVSGLHVIWNLQYLTKQENMKKSNSFVQNLNML